MMSTDLVKFKLGVDLCFVTFCDVTELGSEASQKDASALALIPPGGPLSRGSPPMSRVGHTQKQRRS